MRGEQGRLGAGLVLHFIVERGGQADIIIHLALNGLGEPSVQVDVHHFVAEQHQAENRQAAEGQGAHHQLGADAGTFLVALALDVEFDAGPEQDPAQCKHQDDDQNRDRPENQLLARVGVTELAQPERALPHHEHHGDDQQDRREPVQQALSHIRMGLTLDYTCLRTPTLRPGALTFPVTRFSPARVLR